MTERFTTPLPHRNVNPQLSAIRKHMATDAGLVLFPAIAHDVDIYAATWALLRESLIAAPGSRIEREIAAAAVSTANRCPYCVAAHTTFLHALQTHEAADRLWNDQPLTDPRHQAIANWAKTTRLPAPGPPPTDTGDHPGIIGTTVTFHFVNRMISSLMNEDLLPGGAQKSRTVRRLAATTVARTTRRRHDRGTSLSHLQATDTTTAPGWADTPIATAYSSLTTVTRADDLITPESTHLIQRALNELAGGHPPLGDWADHAISPLPPDQQPAARLALLAACAGYRITDRHVTAWRQAHHTDADLVRLIAHGAMLAVTPIAYELTTAP